VKNGKTLLKKTVALGVSLAVCAALLASCDNLTGFAGLPSLPEAGLGGPGFPGNPGGPGYPNYPGSGGGNGPNITHPSEGPNPLPDSEFIFSAGTIMVLREFAGGSLTIPYMIGGVRVTAIGGGSPGVGFFNRNITLIDIPAGVISIGARAFESNSLTTIYMRNSNVAFGDQGTAMGNYGASGVPDFFALFALNGIGRYAFDPNLNYPAGGWVHSPLPLP